MAQETVKEKRSGRPQKGQTKEMFHAHFVDSVFENVFPISTSCFLHRAAAILRTKEGGSKTRLDQNEQTRGNVGQDCPPGIGMWPARYPCPPHDRPSAI